ncbi:MAG TPA: geranylgeranylglycerol-phosphate geranylgeranyltransferase [Gemmatimonadales bacterium]
MIDGWRLVRGNNLLIAAAGVLAGGWIALGRVAFPNLLVFAAISGIGLGAAGNVVNDVQDAAADRVNHPGGERPLATGRFTRDAAHLLVWLGLIVGLGGAALVSGTQLLVGIAVLGLMLVYSPVLKHAGWPGNLAVATIAGLPPFYGALSVGRPGAGLVPWALAAWIHLGRELVKDLQDEAGDRQAGRRTLPIRIGRPGAVRVAWWICVAFVPGAFLLPALATYSALYYPFAAIAGLVVLLAAAALRRDRLAAASGRLKVAMVIGLVALVLGRVV